jgi:hypothetical protein
LPQSGNAYVAAAPAVALTAMSTCGRTGSAKFGIAEMIAPAAKPTCAVAVRRMPDSQDSPHSERSAGTTVEAENHKPMARI